MAASSTGQSLPASLTISESSGSDNACVQTLAHDVGNEHPSPGTWGSLAASVHLGLQGQSWATWRQAVGLGVKAGSSLQLTPTPG